MIHSEIPADLDQRAVAVLVGNAEARFERPWGYYETLTLGERFQGKRIVVEPGAKLSLQSHMHRSEHWVVVQGAALVTVDAEHKLLGENETTYIPLGAIHRLENPGKLPLHLIEVQSGCYLGEDDIVRYEDIYDRVAAAFRLPPNLPSKPMNQLARMEIHAGCFAPVLA